MKMPKSPDRKQNIPPYMPYRTLVTYLDSLRPFVPNVIDRSSMRSFSGAIQSWLLNGLRYLQMIDDDGKPKPRLHRLAAASDEERKPMLRQLIDAEYGFLKDIDLQRATPKQLEAAFSETGAQGDTVRKSMAFFLAMAKDAGLPLSPLLARSKRRSAPPRTNGSKRPPQGSTVVMPTAEASSIPGAIAAAKSPAELLLGILDPEVMTDEEQAAVWTLLKYLKKPSSGRK
jgi:hypothetical protein